MMMMTMAMMIVRKKYLISTLASVSGDFESRRTCPYLGDDDGDDDDDDDDSDIGNCSDDDDDDDSDDDEGSYDDDDTFTCFCYPINPVTINSSGTNIITTFTNTMKVSSTSSSTSDITSDLFDHEAIGMLLVVLQYPYQRC